jgi:replicative DNA helicase
VKLNGIIAQVQEQESEVIQTGIRTLDGVIGGLHLGKVCTVAGRPVMGKTAFAMSIVRNVGIINKIPTAVFSFDHNEREIAKRLFAAELGWNYVKSTKLSDEMRENVSHLQDIGFELFPQKEKDSYVQKMNEAPVWIEHDVGVTVDEIVGRAEQMKRENGIKVLIIDGMTWVFSGQTFSERVHLMLQLNQLADRLNMAILTTSDLNRSVEKRVGLKKPFLCDLRGGHYAETFSSIVLFVYRPEYYGICEDEMGSTEDVAYIIVSKNDFGALGEVRLRFTNHARFEDADFVTDL